MLLLKKTRDRIESLEHENEQLARSVRELSLLNELASKIGASTDTAQIIQTITRMSVTALEAEQGAVTLVERDTEPTNGQLPDRMKTFVRSMSALEERRPLRLQDELVDWMRVYRTPLVVNDPLRDPRFPGVLWEGAHRSILCVPLLVRSRFTGLLTVYNKRDGKEFTAGDQQLLSIIAAQSAQIIENARLFEEEKRLLHMQNELQLANEIQTNLLPKQPPVLQGYAFAGTSRAAETVGGDFFDFIPIGEHQLGLCVGDVSGKGLAAALLMATVHATLRGQTLTDGSAGACLSRCNRMLYPHMTKSRFATLFYGVLDTQRHTLTYANAGHNRPLLRQADGTLRAIDLGDIVIGALREVTYREASCRLNPGDTLLIYSDGLTEAMNEHRMQFGDRRLATLFRAHGDEPVEALRRRLVKAVRDFSAPAPPHDDLTLIVARRRSS